MGSAYEGPADSRKESVYTCPADPSAARNVRIYGWTWKRAAWMPPRVPASIGMDKETIYVRPTTPLAPGNSALAPPPVPAQRGDVPMEFPALDIEALLAAADMDEMKPLSSDQVQALQEMMAEAEIVRLTVLEERLKQEEERARLLREPKDNYGFREDDDPTSYTRDAAMTLKFQNKVITDYSDALRAGLEEFVDGVKVTVSVGLDCTPGVDVVKGIIQAGSKKDLITGKDLDWNARLLGLVCLAELRPLSKGLPSARVLNRSELYLEIREGMTEADFVQLAQKVKNTPEIWEALRLDVRQRLQLAINATKGSRSQRKQGEMLKEMYGPREGKVISQSREPVTGSVYDYKIELTIENYLYEVKGTDWLCKTYQTESGVRSLLRDMNDQIERHKAGLWEVKNNKGYELVFDNMPAKWQQELILQWGKENAIRISFGGPRDFK